MFDGQGHRSRSPGQKNFFFNEMYCRGAAATRKGLMQMKPGFLPAGSLSMWNSISCTNIGATMWGVFKVYISFFYS